MATTSRVGPGPESPGSAPLAIDNDEATVGPDQLLRQAPRPPITCPDLVAVDQVRGRRYARCRRGGPYADMHGHQRESFSSSGGRCASSVVCPCIAEWQSPETVETSVRWKIGR